MTSQNVRSLVKCQSVKMGQPSLLFFVHVNIRFMNRGISLMKAAYFKFSAPNRVFRHRAQKTVFNRFHVEIIDIFSLFKQKDLQNFAKLQ